MKSRSQKTLLNIGGELALQLVTAVCGFILPRLILSSYGSSVNGIVNSITQIIGIVALLRAGIMNVSMKALFGPIAAGDSAGVSRVVNTLSRFMRWLTGVFTACTVVLAIAYPFIVADEMAWLDAFWLVLIIGVSTYAQCFLGMSRQMLTHANQTVYIISIAQIIAMIIRTALSALLMKWGCSIHVVKLVSAFVYVIPPVCYYLYTQRLFRIDPKEPVDNTLISQRWDALVHQFAFFLNLNMPIIGATLFLDALEVSVYAVYSLVAFSLRKIVLTMTSGMSAAFGNMIEKGEKLVLKKRFGQFELLMYIVPAVAFITCGVLFVPFVMIYTSGVTDADYFRPVLGVLMCLSAFFYCTKMAYETLIIAAGRFRDTKKFAWIDGAITVVGSLLLVGVWGLDGLVLSTVLSGLYCTVAYYRFVAREVLDVPAKQILGRFAYVLVCTAVCLIILTFVPYASADSYLTWFLWAFVVLAIVAAVCFGVSLAMFRNETIELIQWMRQAVFGRILGKLRKN